MTGKDVFPEKDLLEKAATIKRFEYCPLGKELKSQTDIAKKQYQTLDKIYESDEREEPTIKKCNRSNLIYNRKYSFYKYYRDRKKFDKVSFESNDSFLDKRFNDLNKFNKLKTQKEETQKKKTNVHDTASELYNEFLEICHDKQNKFSVFRHLKKKFG